MLYYALVFYVIAMIAGALGIGGVVGASMGMAQVLLFVFLALVLLSVLASLMRRA